MDYKFDEQNPAIPVDMVKITVSSQKKGDVTTVSSNPTKFVFQQHNV